MAEQFLSEPIKPLTATSDTARMAGGEPGLPHAFTWRNETIEITEVLRTWRETGPCRHGSPENYTRKHWFEVRAASGCKMKIYFDRQPRPGSRKSSRWWLFSIDEPE